MTPNKEVLLFKLDFWLNSDVAETLDLMHSISSLWLHSRYSNGSLFPYRRIKWSSLYVANWTFETSQIIASKVSGCKNEIWWSWILRLMIRGEGLIPK